MLGKDYATLKDAIIQYGVVWGECHDDYLNRFADGTWIRTSGIVDWDFINENGDIRIKTFSGTNYRIAADDIRFTFDELNEVTDTFNELLKKQKELDRLS